MKTKVDHVIVAIAGLAVAAGIGHALLRPTAEAAPAAPTALPPMPVAKPAVGGSFADLINGRGPAVTMQTDDLSMGYHLVTLVDPTGATGTYATRGDSYTVSGETYLVTYRTPMTEQAGTLVEPQAGSTAQLLLINMHDIEAITDIRPAVPTQGSPISPNSGGSQPSTPTPATVSPPTP